MKYGKAYEYLLYRPLKFLAGIYFTLRYGYRHDRMKLPEGGNVIVANHTVDVDPFFCLMCFPQPLAIVMSEHLMRKPALGKVLRTVIDPIIRVKTRTESQTAFSMIKRLKAGKNILIFPEGSMTYTGVSKEIIGGLGRLVKISGANLITMRLENTFGYGPRWSKSSGRGRAYGHIINVLDGTELKLMSAGDIEHLIRDDIYFDLNAQEEPEIKNRKRAEYLESFLFLCPQCGGMSKMHGKGTSFRCSCGLDLVLSGNMRFKKSDGGPAPFETLQEWYLWEQEQIKSKAEEFRKMTAAVTADSGVTLNSYTVTPPASTKLLSGKLSLYADRLEVKGEDTISFALADITDVTTVQRRILSFSVNHDSFYEIVGTDSFSPVKYAMLMGTLGTMKVSL